MGRSPPFAAVRNRVVEKPATHARRIRLFFTITTVVLIISTSMETRLIMKTVSCLLVHLAIICFAVAGLLNDPGRKGLRVSLELQRVSAVLSEVNPDSVLYSVRYLSGLETRRFTSDGAAAAVSFITRRLTALGLTVEHQFVEIDVTEGESVIVTKFWPWKKIAQAGAADRAKGAPGLPTGPARLNRVRESWNRQMSV